MSDIIGRGQIVMNSMLSNLDEILITDPYNYISEMTAEERSDNIFRKNPDMFLDYLKDAPYIKSLVASFTSPLKEIFDKGEIHISFNKDELTKYEDFINRKISEVHLKDRILANLDSMVYRGAFFQMLTFTPSTNEFHLVDMKDPWKTTYIERLGKPMGYMRRGNFLDLSEGVFSPYYLAPIKYVSLNDVTVPELRRRLEQELGRKFSSKLDPEVTAYVHFRPRSVFYDQAQQLFQIYLNKFILQFLALKDSIRQDLITVVVQSLPKKVIDTTKVVQAIEEAINQGSNLMVQQDPQSMLSQVIFALFNSARVLPSVENYSAINKLDLLDLKEKRAQLLAETDELEKKMLANLGIPEETQAGTGNRWEILSRSDKYLTTINSYASQGDGIVKNCVVSMMRLMGRSCEASDVNFSFVNDTPLQSQTSRNKAALFIDSLRDTFNAINGVKTIISTGFVDPDKVLPEFLQQIQNWNLPFATSYYSAEELSTRMLNPRDPSSQITMAEF